MLLQGGNTIFHIRHRPYDNYSVVTTINTHTTSPRDLYVMSFYNGYTSLCLVLYRATTTTNRRTKRESYYDHDYYTLRGNAPNRFFYRGVTLLWGHFTILLTCRFLKIYRRGCSGGTLYARGLRETPSTRRCFIPSKR